MKDLSITIEKQAASQPYANKICRSLVMQQFLTEKIRKQPNISRRRATMKQRYASNKTMMLAALALFLPLTAAAFESGSTGTDGAFNPLVDTVLQLPEDGVFNFTTVTIPSGVIVRFKKNTINTPVTMLASGNMTIDGNIYLIGGDGKHTGAKGDGNIGDDGIAGIGAPGGFDGGVGGRPPHGHGGQGLGPGGGQGGKPYSSFKCGGGGGGFGGAGATAYHPNNCGKVTKGGSAYGTATLLPLIGGSGGGGGMAGPIFAGSGGGGGGGAILLASSGTVTVNGRIYAYGGLSGSTIGTAYVNGSGGGGSGGAIRIMATTIKGNGAINANGRGISTNGTSSYSNETGGSGGAGRVRLEAENILRTAATTPVYSFSATPKDIFVAGLPGLVITRVAGVDAPASPSGSADIVLAEDTANPVLVEFSAHGVPVGNTVTLTLTPTYGVVTKVTSDALAGSDQAATAKVSVDIPSGPSTLSASVSFTVTEQQSVAFSAFTEGEKVATVSVDVESGKGSMTTFTTVSGKQYTVPSKIATM